MEITALQSVLQLILYFGGALVLAALLGGAVAGVLRAATQIDDSAIGFFGRLTAVVLLLYFASSYYSSELVGFTSRLWGGADFYH